MIISLLFSITVGDSTAAGCHLEQHCSALCSTVTLCTHPHMHWHAACVVTLHNPQPLMSTSNSSSQACLPYPASNLAGVVKIDPRVLNIKQLFVCC
jgi:hypothetical protein